MGALRRVRALSVLLVALAMVVGGSGLRAGEVAAQSMPGITTTSYGYFTDDARTGFTLVHLEAEDPGLAAEMVSPKYADEFFEGFSIFTHYDFASDLPSAYIDQVDEADEYMVFKGDLDFYDGVKPGYVVMLSTSQEVFLIVGYKSESEYLFLLAEQVITEGRAPAIVGELTRVELEQKTSDGSSKSGSSSSNNSASRTNETGRSFCYIEPAFGNLDVNSDGYLTRRELEVWSDSIPEIEDLLNTMNANGYDSIHYTNC